jgi:hypothetical protein
VSSHLHRLSKLIGRVSKVVPKLRSVAQNEWKKTSIYIFSTFSSKINEFERKKSEKTKKFQKPKSFRQKDLHEKSKSSTFTTSTIEDRGSWK